MCLLGCDIGSSSVKASIVDKDTGLTLASDFYPKEEAAIKAVRPGWAEQNPDDWWMYLKEAIKGAIAKAGIKGTEIDAIGISYQMHGLVLVDRKMQVLRPSVIWCDSRAVPYGDRAFKSIGEKQCLAHLLNSPGNFTASKLAWVKEYEPQIFGQVHKFMLPGDFIAMRMTGDIVTTVSGLSEGIFWDFRNNSVSEDLMNYFGFSKELVPDIRPTFGVQGELLGSVASELGLKKGTPVTYRAGDQPNNALSLNVLNPGEIAATGGTSGVVYGVNGKVNYDTLSRVNTFAHVNHSADRTRLGVLLCINGVGILNSWVKRNVAPEGISYPALNELAATVPIGSEGLSILPFGNGAERMLQNKQVDCSIHGLNFNIHNYFFAKALDQVRPGGVVAFVTSRYTMDAKDSTVRRYLAQRAELLGAIRLPNDAFKKNAGAEVVSDIIFLQKRDRPLDIVPEWTQTGQTEDGFAINRYFIDHPEMVLGRQEPVSTAHGMDYTVNPIEGLELSDQLHDAVKYIHGTYQEAELPELGEGEAIDTSIPADPNVKNYSYAIVDGQVYYRENSRMVRPDLNATAEARVKGLVGLRDCVQELIDLQMDAAVPDSTITQKQAELNRLYDSFSAKYGLINDRANRLAYADDSSYYLLCALEVIDEDGKLERKADMFTKRTIKPHQAVAAVDTASEALAVSISEKACVDMSYMSRLTGKTKEALAGELQGVIDSWLHPRRRRNESL